MTKKNDNMEKNKSHNDGPKTPGGISKSFLTPCRRLGLSRKWKSGSSPFVSPLSQNADNENKTPDYNSNKRKPTKRLHDANNAELQKSGKESCENDCMNNEDIVSTPTRVSSLRRKKSTLTSIEPDKHGNDRQVNWNSSQIAKEELVDCMAEKSSKVDLGPNDSTDNGLYCAQEIKNVMQSSGNTVSGNCSSDNALLGSGSVNKDCVVVLEKQFTASDGGCSNMAAEENLVNIDDEDIPLSRVKKIRKSNSNNKLDNCNDFYDKRPYVNLKVSKLEDKKTSTSDLNQNKKKNRKEKVKSLFAAVDVDRLSSQTSNSFDDDDDFEFDSKRTISIKKTYDKVKLSRAKSTGSITQKDIEELKARIEAKQCLLIAKSNSKEFEELRALIKKWQKGCQEALAELMDLLKKQIPEHQSMSYSKLLKSLNIPPSLAGYDEENDCFVSPSGAEFILA